MKKKRRRKDTRLAIDGSDFPMVRTWRENGGREGGRGKREGQGFRVGVRVEGMGFRAWVLGRIKGRG